MEGGEEEETKRQIAIKEERKMIGREKKGSGSAGVCWYIQRGKKR